MMIIGSIMIIIVIIAITIIIVIVYVYVYYFYYYLSKAVYYLFSTCLLLLVYYHLSITTCLKCLLLLVYYYLSITAIRGNHLSQRLANGVG